MNKIERAALALILGICFGWLISGTQTCNFETNSDYLIRINNTEGSINIANYTLNCERDYNFYKIKDIFGRI